MNIQAEKLELIRWLTSVNDVSILEKIKSFRLKNSKDWWNEISEAEKQAIEQGLKDAEEGKLIPHDKVKKKYEKWL